MVVVKQQARQQVGTPRPGPVRPVPFHPRPRRLIPDLTRPARPGPVHCGGP